MQGLMCILHLALPLVLCSWVLHPLLIIGTCTGIAAEPSPAITLQCPSPLLLSSMEVT